MGEQARAVDEKAINPDSLCFLSIDWEGRIQSVSNQHLISSHLTHTAHIPPSWFTSMSPRFLPKTGQPALLYIVPLTLGPVLLRSVSPFVTFNVNSS